MTDDLSRYLADNPAMTPRDFKGKGFTEFAPFDKHHVAPGELPWDQLDREEVRQIATAMKARFLSRGQRQAAARDPGLIWDERSRSYRLRADSAPAPSTATEGETPAPKKVREPTVSRPAAATEINANRVFRPRFAHASASARDRQGDLP